MPSLSRNAEAKAEMYAAKAAKAQALADKKATKASASPTAAKGWGFSSVSRSPLVNESTVPEPAVPPQPPKPKAESITKAAVDRPPPVAVKAQSALSSEAAADQEDQEAQQNSSTVAAESAKEQVRGAQARAAERAVEAEYAATETDPDLEMVQASQRAAMASSQAVGAYSELHAAEQELLRAEVNLGNLEKDAALRGLLQGSAKEERKTQFAAFLSDPEKSIGKQVRAGLQAMKEDYEKDKASKARKLEQQVQEAGYRIPDTFEARSWEFGGGPLWFLPDKLAPWRSGDDPRGKQSNPGVFMYIAKGKRGTKGPQL